MIPAFDNLLMLLPMTGADDGTSFSDVSTFNRTITANGDAVTKTIAGGVYGSAGYLGEGKYLTVSGDDDFNLNGSGTVSCWVYFTDLSKDAFICYYGIYGNNEPWSIIYQQSSNKLLSSQSGGTPFYSDVLTDLTTGWHHIALVGSGSNYWFFLDGAIVGTRTTGVSFPNAVSDLWIGAMSWEGSSQLIYVQDFAIWNDAIYTSAFIPPERLSGSISNLGGGVAAIRDSNNDPAERTVIAIPRGSQRIYQTQSDANGRYSIALPMIECSVIIYDDDAEPYLNDLFIGRVTPA